jgi:hypothetical protein
VVLNHEEGQMIERYPFLEPIFDRINWHNFSFLHFVRAVEEVRSRAIRLWPIPIPAPLQFGLWLAGQATDYVFFESNTAAVHQNHIIAHEIAHIVLGHKTLKVADATPEAVKALLTSLTATVDSAQPVPLMRDLLDMRSPVREEAAEELATAIQQELIRRAGLLTMAAGPTRAPLWNEYALALGLSD